MGLGHVYRFYCYLKGRIQMQMQRLEFTEQDFTDLFTPIADFHSLAAKV